MAERWTRQFVLINEPRSHYGENNCVMHANVKREIRLWTKQPQIRTFSN
jgi:hypothetical protein